MMEAMPRPRLPHLQRERTRHGRWVWYVRVRRGARVRLKGEYGSPDFMAEYHAAIKAKAPTPVSRASQGTLKWLIETYTASPEWAKTAAETRKQFGYQFRRMEESAGATEITEITQADIMAGRDRRAATPSDANKFVRASRRLFAYATGRKWLTANPAAEVETLGLPNAADGFHTWTPEEAAAFESRWPVGTRQRLAFDILLYTGLRRSDAVRLGRQHVRNGELTIKTDKTGEIVALPLLAPVVASIKAAPTGDLTFIVTARGTAFDKATFGNWFRKTCQAAKVPGSAHGLRKLGAVRAAENGATEAQLNAIFGWKDGSRESATYTRKARRAKLAKQAAKLLIVPHLSKGASRTHGKILK